MPLRQVIKVSPHLRVLKLSLLLDAGLAHNLRLHIIPLKVHRCVVVGIVLGQLELGIIFKVIQVLVFQGQGAWGQFPRLNAHHDRQQAQAQYLRGQEGKLRWEITKQPS